MKIMTTSDLSYVSGGDYSFCDEGGQWYTYKNGSWVVGLVVTAAYDAAVSGYRWAANNVATATEGSVSTNCDSLGNCY